MSNFHIHKGKDIKLKGAADKTVVDAPVPKQAAVQPQDFRGFKARLAVKEGDTVKKGTPIISDKENADIRILSPIAGKISAINRGDKRILLEVVIDSDGSNDVETFDIYREEDVAGLSRDTVIKQLLVGGLWPTLRQRPFSKIASPEDKPKSIFVRATNTDPLALDVDVVLEGKEKEFQVGLDIIKKLTDGDVHLCINTSVKSSALTSANNVVTHQFSGPHPAGNVSTHIHNIDPINKGDVVWYVEAQDVLRIAALFLTGQYSAERVVAVTGEGAEKRTYVKTVVGASISSLVGESNLENARYISGSILTGKNVGKNGYVCFYDSQITIIPEGRGRQLLGWLVPGFKKYTFSKTYASAFLPATESSLDTDENGGHRAIVLNHIYDEYVPLDIMTYFLLKAVISGDIEESERLGILEVDEEDFALCTFACPSKTDVGGIIREGLELIEAEG